MRKILLVTADLIKSTLPEPPPQLPIREKMIAILKERIKTATTDNDRIAAENDLRVFVGLKSTGK